ncbi:fibronectin type III-like domain-contianing protein [Microbacterium sp. NPDC056044]|uniref:fibronectin type III-like domain-contianing protein n=1 Tax=Microbacterium sp. NPDC056044 TaxID=3345690 RepID=UPI0035D6AEF6
MISDTDPAAQEPPTLTTLLDTLRLEEKILLLAGRDFWTTHPLENIGLRSLRFSDGPSGVRGELWDERSPSLNLPSGTASGATWDVDLARRFGTVAAAEARRKQVDVVLGPTINLHRSPLGGGHFESYDEDPMLTGETAVANVTGLQSSGIGATPKDYLGYTSWSVEDAQVDDTAADGIRLSVNIRNTGHRRGKHVVRVYAARRASSIERPARWLVGFASIQLDAGEARRADVHIFPRAFRHWQVGDEAGWRYEPGTFDLHVETSVTATPLNCVVDLSPSGELSRTDMAVSAEDVR